MASSERVRAETYREVASRIESLLEGERDWVAIMATVVCELHHAFEHFDWTGFYRVVEKGRLVVGPYQGVHGCLRIEQGRGVCGEAAAQRRTIVVEDVRTFPGYIRCDERTLSEIVVPVMDGAGGVRAVLDVDSHTPAAFRAEDVEGLEAICRRLGERLGGA